MDVALLNVSNDNLDFNQSTFDSCSADVHDVQVSVSVAEERATCDFRESVIEVFPRAFR
jgi:hypothetical protein